MKIDLDRLCTLAGVAPSKNNTNRRSRIIREGYKGKEDVEELAAFDPDAMAGEGKEVDELVTVSLEEDEGLEEYNEDEAAMEELDQVIEVDEAMLVQELRRAKKILSENKKREAALVENELKKIIESEVSNVMRELNLTSGWMYGNKRPKRSRKGFVNQGSFMKGIGFK